ncbi:MAG: serine/threonine-protein kinase [Verrucomicrobiota bacterium]
MNPDALAARIGNQLDSSGSNQTELRAPGPPPPIADHEILSRIAVGNYGEVWLARSVTGAMRAVKVVWRSRFSSERPYEREFRGIVQFEPISRSHPGVVNVLHVGRDDSAGCFFYVMELADAARPPVQSSKLKVQGLSASTAKPDKPATTLNSEPERLNLYVPRTLAADLRAHGRMPVTDSVALGVQLANSLGHLHRHGLVHRDVKPSNVIFVDGHAKLADIGLVVSVSEARSFVGTEGFIPPEGPGSEQADLFSLGRLLYEAATGKDRCEFPRLPGDLDQWTQPEREAMLELNEVLARVCAADPKHRHANAAELAGDLNLILAGRSVRRAYGMERRVRQATRITIAAAIIVLVAMAVVWFQGEQQHHSKALAARETALRQRAEAAEHESQQQLYTALLEQARALVLTADLGQRVRALDAVRRAGAISNSAALRGVAVAALALPDLRFEREWPTTPDTTLANLDPAFERIALCHGTGPVEIRSMTDQQLLVTLPASTNLPAHLGLWSQDGRFFAVGRRRDPDDREWDVEVWEVAVAKQVLLVPASPSGVVSFHPHLPQILIGRDATAVFWNLENGQELTHHRLEGKPVALKFAPNGEYFGALFPIGQEWMAAIHNASDGTTRAKHVFANRVRVLDWHPSGRWIVVPDFGGTIHWMDVQTGDTRVLGRHKSAAVIAVFSPDGKYLLSGGWDRELICWDVKAMRRAFAVGLESYHVQFRTDGSQCAVLVWPNMRLQLHDFERPGLCREFAEDLGGANNYAAFSADGRWLAGCGGERVVVWDLTREGPGVIANDTASASVSFAPNGELFANRPEECFRWRVHGGTNGAAPALERMAMSKPEGFVSLCLVSNAVVFTSTQGSKLARFDQLAIEQGTWKPTADGLNGASPDGRWLGMYGSFTPDFYVYRLPGLERVAKLTNEASISSFEFSPRGDEVAVCSRGGVEFWSTTSWQRTRHLTNFTSLLYSPDAKTFWLSTDWRTAGLHDARTAESLLPLPPNTIPLAISPDGRHLAVSVDLRRVQVWDLVEVRAQLRELGLDWEERGTADAR